MLRQIIIDKQISLYLSNPFYFILHRDICFARGDKKVFLLYGVLFLYRSRDIDVRRNRVILSIFVEFYRQSY